MRSYELGHLEIQSSVWYRNSVGRYIWFISRVIVIDNVREYVFIYDCIPEYLGQICV